MSLESDLKTMVESLGLALYDTAIVSENGETIYRVSVMKAGGVSMEDVVEATRLISPMLDVTPPVSGEYRLEVSSPGIERKLSTLAHFEHSIGEKVAITTREKEKLSGTLLHVNGSMIGIDDTEAGKIEIDFDAISKAKTYFEW